jgi:hypothetical protein
VKRLALLAALVLSSQAGAQQVSLGQGAVLRGLDKITGQVSDIEVANGAAAQLGRLQIELGECRYPEDNPAGNAYAYLTIYDEGAVDPVFSGWMIASAPALNALDNARYDVWVIRCKTE